MGHRFKFSLYVFFSAPKPKSDQVVGEIMANAAGTTLFRPPAATGFSEPSDHCDDDDEDGEESYSISSTSSSPRNKQNQQPKREKSRKGKMDGSSSG